MKADHEEARKWAEGFMRRAAGGGLVLEPVAAGYLELDAEVIRLRKERARLRVFLIGVCSTLDRAAPFLPDAGAMRDMARALIGDIGDTDDQA